jgi:hypothetical protein
LQTRTFRHFGQRQDCRRPAEIPAADDSDSLSSSSAKAEDPRLSLLQPRERQDRIRRYQIGVLLLSAAASFPIGIKTLLSNNDDSVPFPHVMHGAWLPISVAALLVPVFAEIDKTPGAAGSASLSGQQPRVADMLSEPVAGHQ